jgi:TetR/AcrR family transcriptional regulator, transcriptional repressor for nem operon
MARASLREKIVDAALERFHVQGFNGCSVQDITEAAGAPKGSFYNHFKTKELLALEALDRYLQDSRTAMLFEGDKSPLQRVRAHFEFLAARAKGWGFGRGCMINNLGTDMADSHPAMREALAEALLEWDNALATVLRQAQATGEVSKEKDVDLLARSLINLWEGATIRGKIVKSRAAFDDFFAVAFDMLLV